jgi:hypothetical protein
MYADAAVLADGVGEYAYRFYLNLVARDFSAYAFLIELYSQVAHDLIALSSLQACVRDCY